MRHLIRTSALLLSSIAPLPGHAATCDAVAVLAHIHDAYIALAAAEKETRETAAVALLALHLPDVDPARLKDELGDRVALDEDRLAMILQDTLGAAQSMATSGKATLSPNSVADTEWLADIVWDSGCEAAWGSDGPARRPPPPPPSALGGALNLALGAALSVAGVGGLIFGAVMVRRSPRFRRRELRQQPRKPVSLHAVAILQNGDRHEVRVLDLSLGGMRIMLEDAPPQSSPITLEIGDLAYPATIAWRNDFYAGILLDTPLTDAGLGKLLDLNVSAAGGTKAPGSK